MNHHTQTARKIYLPALMASNMNRRLILSTKGVILASNLEAFDGILNKLNVKFDF